MGKDAGELIRESLVSSVRSIGSGVCPRHQGVDVLVEVTVRQLGEEVEQVCVGLHTIRNRCFDPTFLVSV